MGCLRATVSWANPTVEGEGQHVHDPRNGNNKLIGPNTGPEMQRHMAQKRATSTNKDGPMSHQRWQQRGPQSLSRGPHGKAPKGNQRTAQTAAAPRFSRRSGYDTAETYHILSQTGTSTVSTQLFDLTAGIQMWVWLCGSGRANCEAIAQSNPA